MKTTAQRLSEVYCRPNNSEWVDLIGYVPNRDTATYAVYDGELRVIDANESEVTYLTEVQSSHFIDLLQDKIVPWRLEEDGIKCVGFSADGGSSMHGLNLTDKASALMVRFPIDGSHPVIRLGQFDEEKFNQVTFKGCATYTDLLTLIKLIG